MNMKATTATLLTAIFLISAIAVVTPTVNAQDVGYTWNEATAEWSTDEAYSGSYSVFLSVYFDGTKDAWLYQGDKYGEEGAIISLTPSDRITLGDFTEFSFHFLMADPRVRLGIESPRTAMLLDTDGDGFGDVWLVTNSLDYNTAPYWNDVEETYKAPYTWQLHDELSFMVWTQDPDTITGLGETAKEETGRWYRPESGMFTLSQLLTKGLTGDIVRYEVRLDGVDKDPVTGRYTVGVPVTCSVYIDDVAVNGVLYGLEVPLPRPSMGPSPAQLAAIDTAGDVLGFMETGVIAPGENLDYNGDGVVNVADAFDNLVDHRLIAEPTFSFEPTTGNTVLTMLQGIYGTNLEHYPTVEGRVWLLYMLG